MAYDKSMRKIRITVRIENGKVIYFSPYTECWTILTAERLIKDIKWYYCEDFESNTDQQEQAQGQ